MSPAPAKFFVAAMFREEEVLKRAIAELEKAFGRLDFESEVFEFNFTRYYEEEFGNGLKKLFIAFKEPLERDKLVDAKLKCIKIEDRFSVGQRRRVNLDPGYVTLGSVVLSTTKERAHRVYLGQGVFAEVALIYVNGRFQSLPWSYADYRTEIAQRFFLSLRERLREELRQGRNT